MFGNSANHSDLISFFTDLGGKLEHQNGVKMFAGFTSVEDELFSLFNGVGLRYLNNHSIIELKGEDSLDFLHRISSNSIKDMKKEDVRDTIFTSEKGRIIGLSTIFNFESYLLLVSSSASQPKIISWINKYVVSDDVKVSDANHRFNILEISGPQSQSFINFTCGENANEIPENSFDVVSNEGIMFFLAKIKKVNGQIKYWALADLENTKKLVKYFIENKGPYDFNLIGEEAYNAYRIEMGIPSDAELNDFFNPLEAKLNHLIDFKKGCYIGQEVIARLDTYDKVQKNIIGICFSQPVETKENFILLDNRKQEIGSVTSIAYSTRLKKHIALGYVKRTEAVHGTKLVAKNESKEIEVNLHDLPFKK